LLSKQLVEIVVVGGIVGIGISPVIIIKDIYTFEFLNLGGFM